MAHYQGVLTAKEVCSALYVENEDDLDPDEIVFNLLCFISLNTRAMHTAMAAAENVIIFCLPLHTTADSQPLDTSGFGPHKDQLVTSLSRSLVYNPGNVITKFQFSRLFSQTWSKGMTISNVTSVFRHLFFQPKCNP